MISKENIQFVLTDIEGTTTSISFVYEILFPYFRQNMDALKQVIEEPEIQVAIQQIKDLALEENNQIETMEEVIQQLEKWADEDKKITPLKTIQGFLWKKGYEDGAIKGHVYADVPVALKEWKSRGTQLGVFSSGSVQAQKLLFKYSEFGDLDALFSANFDTNTGAKRDTKTYLSIAENLQLEAKQILFLSDIVEELVAAKEAGLQTIQLVREGNTKNWEDAVASFDEIQLI